MKLEKRSDFNALTKDEIRDFIGEVQDLLVQKEQLDLPIKHYFSKGVYAREMSAPKDALIVGKIHKYKNLNILSKGEVSVLSVEGVVRLKAPATFVSCEGVKRVIKVHEDCIWTTIHGTNETDLEKIEDEVIVKFYAELEG